MSRTRSQSVLKNDLPSISKMELSDNQLTSYLSDLFSGAKTIEIRVKDSAQAHFRSVARLSELHVALLNKHVWGAEVSYDYAGELWTDTLQVHPHAVLLSRKPRRAVMSA